MRPSIHSVKHYVHRPITTTVQAAIGVETIVEAVTVATGGANAKDVVEGSLVKAVYLEYWLTGDAAALSSGTVLIEKVPAGQVPVTFAQSQNLGAYPNKKNVLECHQGLFPSSSQNPQNIFRHWVKIPKGKQRMGLGDKLVISFAAVGDGIITCGFTTYKEYT